MATLPEPTAQSCPLPFLLEDEYPTNGGYLAGRYCGPLAAGQYSLSCCLPCPLEDWVYSDNFHRNLEVAYYLNIPGLVCQVFLLVTFAVLPEDMSHRHYLSVNLCVALILLELSFIIPLGTKPSLCNDRITPGDLHTSLSCGWSAALLIVGTMAVAVWILLRSIWTHLRVCWDVKQTPVYFYVAQVLGWGLPGVFLADTLAITGASYQLGPSCMPNHEHVFVTWSGWLIAFACLSMIVQFSTTGFCFALYARHLMQHKDGTPPSDKYDSRNNVEATANTKPNPIAHSARRLAWGRVAKVITLQWRSIALCVLAIVQTTFYGVVFVQESTVTSTNIDAAQAAAIENWTRCIAINNGDKNACLALTRDLGINEGTVTTSLFINALIGLVTFTLMLRWSMLQGWWRLLRHPSRSPRSFSTGKEDFFIVAGAVNDRKNKNNHQQQQQQLSQNSPGRHRKSSTSTARRRGPHEWETISRLIHGESRTVPATPSTPAAAAAAGKDAEAGGTSKKLRIAETSRLARPEAGDVTRRHETTNFFEAEEIAEGDSGKHPRNVTGARGEEGSTRQRLGQFTFFSDADDDDDDIDQVDVEGRQGKKEETHRARLQRVNGYSLTR